jgi:hypothetical protein
VPEAEEVGADADLQYVEVFDNLRVLRLTPLTKASPSAFNLVFQNYIATMYG